METQKHEETVLVVTQIKSPYPPNYYPVGDSSQQSKITFSFPLYSLFRGVGDDRSVSACILGPCPDSRDIRTWVSRDIPVALRARADFAGSII